MTPNTDTFRNALQHILEQANELGLSAIELSAGALHRRVGGYPDTNHRMVPCCNAMKEAMQADDAILNQPEKGLGASLTIRYVLPRS